MKTVPTIVLILLPLFLLVAGAAADTIQVQNVKVTTIEATVPVNIILDTTPAGVAGFDITVSLSNPSVATITDVSLPSWAILKENSTLPASSVHLRTVDLNEQIQSGATNIPFGTVTLRGDAVGSTDVVVTIKMINDDDGNDITPEVRSGKFSIESAGSQPIIADHTSTKLSHIPKTALDTARSTLHIAYGHTSHGSQVTDGMTGLNLTFPNAPHGNATYNWSDGVKLGALDLDDYFVAGDLGNPDRTTWAQRTRDYLNNPANSDVNVVMWSWCGQVDATEAEINTYLNLMNQLESDYQNVKFVYMTGHLDGSGAEGNVNLRNEQIRAYARTNNKILYDFADIESYDPDGLVNYMELAANDNCDYDSNGDGSRDKNWATIWQAAHPGEWYTCSAAHSQPLNGNQKAYAAWWLWARLGGWDGSTEPEAPVAAFSGTPLSGSAPLEVQFTDESTGTPERWSWNFGDGGTSTLQNPEHIYTSSGTYTISLEVSNAAGSDSVSHMDYIRVTSTVSKVGVVRDGYLWLLDSTGDGKYTVGDLGYVFGKAGDVYVTGDWNGDKRTEIGVVRDGNRWLLDASGDGKYGAGDYTYTFGKAGDVYVTGDWNGDGRSDIGVVRNANGWLLDASGDGKYGAGDLVYSLGKDGDMYVTGDWNGDRRTEIGVVRDGFLWLLDSTGDGRYTVGDLGYVFGKGGDMYVTGDWNGDRRTEIGIVRNGNGWLLDASGDGKYGTGDLVYSLGKAGDAYVTGAW